MADHDRTHFEKPPVVERVLGVQFDPLRSLTSAHLGAYWVTLGDGWRQTVDAPPLPPQFEEFGEGALWGRGGVELRLVREPQTRLMIRHDDQQRMIQIQNGRIFFNKLESLPGAYEPFESVEVQFHQQFSDFRAYLQKNNIADLRLNQWEVTYVNRIARGTLWNDPDDWRSVFANAPVLHSSPAGTRLEGVNAAWQYEIEPRRGRLHVELKHGRTDEGGSEALLFTLTARGPIRQTDDLASGLRLGHDVIVKAFVDLTSNQSHKYWELQHA